MRQEKNKLTERSFVASDGNVCILLLSRFIMTIWKEDQLADGMTYIYRWCRKKADYVLQRIIYLHTSSCISISSAKLERYGKVSINYEAFFVKALVEPRAANEHEKVETPFSGAASPTCFEFTPSDWLMNILYSKNIKNHQVFRLFPISIVDCSVNLIW